MEKNKIQILGIRGIPAAHGGFETFAEGFCEHLQRRGWDVTVYCQKEARESSEDTTWNGIHLVNIPILITGALGTIAFDLLSAIKALRRGSPCLILGYNTAIFAALLNLKGIPYITNMDGIEWSREKWSIPAKIWLYCNERIATIFSNKLIADHPEIKVHLSRHVAAEKISMIPYGAAEIIDKDFSFLDEWNLKANNYALVIARPEPENSILEIVKAWSLNKLNMPLVVLGNYNPNSRYHREILTYRSNSVLFPGAIYDKGCVAALRANCRIYFHGHRVGGTNPSLIEAMASKNAIIAHDNRFNRWVAGESAVYFSSSEHCQKLINSLIDDESRLGKMREAAHCRIHEDFMLDNIHSAYENEILNLSNLKNPGSDGHG